VECVFVECVDKESMLVSRGDVPGSIARLLCEFDLDLVGDESSSSSACFNRSMDEGKEAVECVDKESMLFSLADVPGSIARILCEFDLDLVGDESSSSSACFDRSMDEGKESDVECFDKEDMLFSRADVPGDINRLLCEFDLDLVGDESSSSSACFDRSISMLPFDGSRVCLLPKRMACIVGDNSSWSWLSLSLSLYCFGFDQQGDVHVLTKMIPFTFLLKDRPKRRRSKEAQPLFYLFSIGQAFLHLSAGVYIWGLRRLDIGGDYFKRQLFSSFVTTK
jgi:hypothetical protein